MESRSSSTNFLCVSCPGFSQFSMADDAFFRTIAGSSGCQTADEGGAQLTVHVTRRTLIKTTGALGGVAVCGALVRIMALTTEAQNWLRPPGALEEARFLASCIKCGQCVQVCPFHSLRLLDLFNGGGMVLPTLIQPNEGAIYAIYCPAYCAVRLGLWTVKFRKFRMLAWELR